MKWENERDNLIAQTKAFVRSVTGLIAGESFPMQYSPAQLPSTQPFSVLSPPTQPASGEDAFAEAAATSVTHVVPDMTLEQADQASAQPSSAQAASELPPVEAPSQVGMRQEIQARVAAFQAHQHRFESEREAYFDSTLTKVRSAIETGRNAPPA